LLVDDDDIHQCYSSHAQKDIDGPIETPEPLDTDSILLYIGLLLQETNQANATLFFLPPDFGFGLSVSALFDFALEAPPLCLRL
jgi:hypothetical protein